MVLGEFGQSLQARFFDDRDLANGRIYFEQGQVAIIGSDGSGFGCEVKGSQRRPYAVEIEWNLARKSDVLIAYCNCPRFADAEICKHVAAALAADAAGLGNRVVGTQHAIGIITAEDADSFDYLDDDDDDDFDEPIAPRRAVGMEPADPRHPKSKSRRPASRRVGSSLLSHAQYQPGHGRCVR